MSFKSNHSSSFPFVHKVLSFHRLREEHGDNQASTIEDLIRGDKQIPDPSGLPSHCRDLPCRVNVCICVFDKDRERKKKARENLWWFMKSRLGVYFWSGCVLRVRVSRWEVLPAARLRHSVYQRRAVLFVLLHPSVSDGSLMVMTSRAVAARIDAALGRGGPPSAAPAPRGVLHAALVVAVHTDLQQQK